MALPTRCPPFSTYQRRRRPARRPRASSEPFWPSVWPDLPGQRLGRIKGGNFSLSLMVERQRCRYRRNIYHLPIHPLHHPPDGLQGYSSIRIGHRNLRRHVEPSQSRLPRLELDERLGGSDGISARLVPEQHADRLEAGALCFARLIGLLLGDPRQRPANRAPSAAGGCNPEARRRYLLESRALDPQRQRLLLVLSGLELRRPGRMVATAAF